VGFEYAVMLTALIAFGMSAAAGAQTPSIARTLRTRTGHRPSAPANRTTSAVDGIAAVARDRPAVSGRCRTHT